MKPESHISSAAERKSKLTFSNILIAILVVINILPVLAPIFQHWGWELPAKVIYFIYSFMCHQIHWRSLHVYDHQCAWCARDMAIWGGVLFTAVAIKVLKIKGIKWYQILPFMIPIALDGGIQTIASVFGITGGSSAATATPLYVSTNLMRAITGGIFGIGLGAVLMPIALEIENIKLKEKFTLFRSKIQLPYWAILPAIMALILALYMVFIQIWGATSSTVLPSNFLDSEVKAPSYGSEIIERRANGICPIRVDAKSDDISSTLALDCFFGEQ